MKKITCSFLALVDFAASGKLVLYLSGKPHGRRAALVDHSTATTDHQERLKYKNFIALKDVHNSGAAVRGTQHPETSTSPIFQGHHDVSFKRMRLVCVVGGLGEMREGSVVLNGIMTFGMF